MQSHSGQLPLYANDRPESSKFLTKKVKGGSYEKGKNHLSVGYIFSDVSPGIDSSESPETGH